MDREPLFRRWVELFPDASVRDVQRIFDYICQRYDEPHRHYHTLANHIEALLEAQALYFPKAHRSLKLAIWLHDLVYDGRPGDDERCSAAVSSSLLSELAVPQEEIKAVVDLILCTINHVPSAPGASMLCDLDLMSLGTSNDQYWATYALIRQEYAHVSDADWYRGRRAFIQRFLDRPNIFTTLTLGSQFETAARYNLQVEQASMPPLEK